MRPKPWRSFWALRSVAPSSSSASEPVTVPPLPPSGGLTSIRRGAAGIRQQIEQAGRDLLKEAPFQAVGFGFGGPINGPAGIVTTSHQIEGWDNFPLAEWCTRTLGVPTYLGNDCDMAALAEARFGGGRGKRGVLYVTVGTGVGGGLVLDGALYGSDRPAIAEIGHLRPGLEAVEPSQTIESISSGRGIEAAARIARSKPADRSRCRQIDQAL